MSLRSGVPIVSYRGITSVPRRWNPDQWTTYLSPRIAAHGCESMAVADALVAAGVDRDRCHVVHNCVGSPPAPLSRDDARRKLGIDRDAIVVMMVANMRRVKGADLLLRAATECLHLPRLHCLLVGRVLDPEVERLARQSQLENRVTLTGYRADAAELLGGADMFVMPSRAEALSVALLEAMACGVCPVVSNAGGMKEAVRHEQDGLVVPSEDVAALASAISTLYDDRERRNSFGRSAHERAAAQFSARAMATRLSQVYRAVWVGRKDSVRPLGGIAADDSPTPDFGRLVVSAQRGSVSPPIYR
jgi:glycosyltransferase involved in cell wall biosynthesis